MASQTSESTPAVGPPSHHKSLSQARQTDIFFQSSHRAKPILLKPARREARLEVLPVATPVPAAAAVEAMASLLVARSTQSKLGARVVTPEIVEL